ncbi:MAG: helix-turn-helix transcriptional regulator [Phycisphaerales bacterium]|nr:MAG: helix-turn-helix transcriptional regulator [Phycisphaerales bacterium]
MTRIRKQTLDGKIETLILAVLEDGPSYGYAIVKQLNRRCDGILKLGEGTVYPVLHRLEEKQMISSKWQTAENGRPRKYYRLNRKGHRAFAENLRQWRMLASVMEKVVGSCASILPKPQLKGGII